MCLSFFVFIFAKKALQPNTDFSKSRQNYLPELFSNVILAKRPSDKRMGISSQLRALRNSILRALMTTSLLSPIKNIFCVILVWIFQYSIREIFYIRLLFWMFWNTQPSHFSWAMRHCKICLRKSTNLLQLMVPLVARFWQELWFPFCVRFWQ